MATLDRPRLRPLGGHQVNQGGVSYVAFDDSQGLANPNLLVPTALYFQVLSRFDGQTALADVQEAIRAETGHFFPMEDLKRIVRQLDEALILDGPTFAALREAYRSQTSRPAALAGRAYEAAPQALRKQLERFFRHENGSGAPGPALPQNGSRLRGVLSPHIDFGRGGHVYSWAYKDLIERSDADVFVIFGVSHQYGTQRFILTKKDFETPLGVARTNREYVDALVSGSGEHLFDDELVHQAEHSIEFQVVFLQYVLGDSRPFTIVPILVGSFHDLMESGREPIDDPEIKRFVGALRAAEASCPGKVAYIGGIDLGHVGRVFGDKPLLDAPTLDALRKFDASMLAAAAQGDPSAWFRHAASVGNKWRICGLAATYTMLQVMGEGTKGTRLRYDQAVNPERTCCVSFASLAFEAPTEPEVTDG
jgi:AmmeMemoRadiSam system protein B